MTDTLQPSADQLDARLAEVGPSPRGRGTVELVVCRPDVGQRRVLDHAELVVGAGLAGDNHVERGNARTHDGLADPEAQLNLMNSRCIEAVAGRDRSRWPLAGDQFFVDFDLSAANIPPGTRLAIGDAVIEVSPKPHNGCAKFAERFGIDAARWANANRDERRRGINAIVIEAGTVRPGDEISKL